MQLTAPLIQEDIDSLTAGDRVKLSGEIYTARDAAHARMVKTLKAGKNLPFNLQGQVIYYVGPSPAPPGRVIGSAGPTTSYRMDPYTPQLLEEGLKGMIGKGARSKEIREAMIKYGAIYFAAVGGAAALIAESISTVEIVAYPDLGTEAVRRLEVEDLPLIVINDTQGNDLYSQGANKYMNQK
ncbi:MAG: Fe-S-containing hydro-lyase [Halanaerobiaceae bacterium]